MTTDKDKTICQCGGPKAVGILMCYYCEREVLIEEMDKRRQAFLDGKTEPPNEGNQ